MSGDPMNFGGFSRVFDAPADPANERIAQALNRIAAELNVQSVTLKSILEILKEPKSF